MDTVIKYLRWPVLLAPVIYGIITWSSLPDTVPLHYSITGEPDRYGNKSELMAVLGIIVTVNIGMYFLLANIHRIDPKKKFQADNLPKMKRLAFFISLFLSAIACFILYTSLQQGLKFDSRFIIVAVGLLFAGIGNYMYSIKPNYFAGIRTPWTLENEENWRLTHQFGGKLWFAGGLLMAVTGFFISSEAAVIVMLSIVGILAVVPVVYSYRLYQKHKKSAGHGNGA